MRLMIVYGILAGTLACGAFAQTVRSPLQVGGDVSAPKLLKHPDVHAPLNSGAGDEGGEAEVTIVVDGKGRVASAQISKSSGNLEFDANAVSAAKRYVFEPARRNGVPVAVQTSIAMNYRTHLIR